MAKQIEDKVTYRLQLEGAVEAAVESTMPIPVPRVEEVYRYKGKLHSVLAVRHQIVPIDDAVIFEVAVIVGEGIDDED